MTLTWVQGNRKAGSGGVWTENRTSGGEYKQFSRSVLVLSSVLPALRFRPVYSSVQTAAMGGRVARCDRVLCGVLVLVTVASVLVSVSSACAPVSEGARPRRMAPEEFPEVYNSSLDRDKVSKQTTLLIKLYLCYSLFQTQFITYQLMLYIVLSIFYYLESFWKVNTLGVRCHVPFTYWNVRYVYLS